MSDNPKITTVGDLVAMLQKFPEGMVLVSTHSEHNGACSSYTLEPCRVVLNSTGNKGNSSFWRHEVIEDYIDETEYMEDYPEDEIIDGLLLD